MAIYHASTKSLSRSDGRSAVASVAYRAGARLTDERTGLVHDYSRRTGVAYVEVLTPDGGPADRSELWNAVEAAERRKDSRTGREWVLALPAELDAEQRRELARGFALELVRRYGVAVDMAIHEPSREGDERNHHAHLFATTRTVSRSESGALVLGEKVAPELSDTKRRKLGLNAASEEVAELRQLWERLANEALERAGREERITAKSFEAQGIDREPTTHLGPSATAMEGRGEPSERGEINRQAEARNAEREAVQAEIIDLKAERDRRAKEAQELREREEIEAKAKEQARQEAARQEEARKEREAWEAMKPAQLREEIFQNRLSPVELLIFSDEAVQAARAQEADAMSRQRSLDREIAVWRKANPVQTWLHDWRLYRSSELGAQERSREEARREAEASERRAESARQEARERITEAQRPTRDRLEVLEAILERKEAAEARREAQERQRAEAARREAQAREQAQRAAREAAEREAARKAEEERAAKDRERERFVGAIMEDPSKAHKLRDSLLRALEAMPEGPDREKTREVIKTLNEAIPALERLKEPKPWQDMPYSSPQERPAPKPKTRDRGGWDRDR